MRRSSAKNFEHRRLEPIANLVSIAMAPGILKTIKISGIVKIVGQCLPILTSDTGGIGTTGGIGKTFTSKLKLARLLKFISVKYWY